MVESKLPPGCSGPREYTPGLWAINDASGAQRVWGCTSPAFAIFEAWEDFTKRTGITQAKWEAMQKAVYLLRHLPSTMDADDPYMAMWLDNAKHVNATMAGEAEG